MSQVALADTESVATTATCRVSPESLGGAEPNTFLGRSHPMAAGGIMAHLRVCLCTGKDDGIQPSHRHMETRCLLQGSQAQSSLMRP